MTGRVALNKAQMIAERLRQQVEQLWIVNEPSQMQVTVSIGIADMQPEESLEATLKRSDRALYQAKAQGRNRVEYWQQTT